MPPIPPFTGTQKPEAWTVDYTEAVMESHDMGSTTWKDDGNMNMMCHLVTNNNNLGCPPSQ